MSDLGAAARQLMRRPGLSVLIVAVLAVGIGVNVAMYSMLEQALLNPLPVAEPGRLVNLTDPGPDAPGPRTMSLSGGPDSIFSYPMFRDLERAQTPFAGIAAHRPFAVSVSTGAQGQTGDGVLASGSYFPVLGLEPALGRLLGPADDGVDGVAQTVVLSHGYWQSAFGGDPDVVGRTLIVNGVPLTIVGVAPRGFHGTTVGVRASVFVPITFRWLVVGADDSPTDRLYRWIHLFARLKPELGREQAEAAINASYRGILDEADAPLYTGADARTLEAFRTKSLVLEPGARGQSLMLGPLRGRFDVLFAVSGVVLLLCCANVAGLMLVRGAARIGEMAVRASIGATRGRIASLLLAESLALALPAAVLGIGIALLTLEGMAAGVGEIAGVRAAAYDVALDSGAALVAIGIAVAAALLFGLYPALSLARTDPAKTLQAYGVRQTSNRAAMRFGTALATSQIALSVALLAITGVFAQSLANIGRVDLGFDAQRVATFSLSPATSGYSPEASADLYARLEEALAAVPGVASVSSSELPWLSGFTRSAPVLTDAMDSPGSTLLHYVGAGFFDTLGVALLAGREFGDGDRAGAPAVAVVNERFAEQHGLGADVVGKRIRLRGETVEIVGVAANAKYTGVTGETEAQVFRPRRQSTEVASASFYVRGARPPDDLIDAIRETVTRVDPVVPVSGLQTMTQQVRQSFATERFVAGASTVFAALATVLAGLGLYGVLAYAVAARSREIGLRFALGAPASRIRAMVLGRTAAMALVGIPLGAAAAMLVGRAAGGLLFGVDAGDPAALVAAVAVLTAVTLVAAYVPIRRALGTDPMTALRYE